MLHGFLRQDGSIIKDPTSMAEVGAEYYEKFFEKSENIVRPHSYTDAPWPDWDNYEEKISEVYLEEVLETVHIRKKKKSCDAHGLCNYMFNFLPISYWCLLLIDPLTKLICPMRGMILEYCS